MIASSALTVIGAFAALFFARLGSLDSLAPGLIIAVAIMLITALTLIPAVISILSKAMFWPVGPGHEPQRSAFAALGRSVAYRPVITAAAIGVTLIVLAVFSSGYKATYDTLGEMPSDTPSQQAFDTLAASMPPGDLSPTQVYVKANGPIPQNELAALTTNLEGVAGVAAVTPPRVSQDGTAAVVNVVLDTSPFSTQALDTIDDSLRPVAHSSVPGAVVAVGGQTATLADVRSQLHSDTRHVFPVAVVIVWIILGALLLAVLAPVNLIVSVFVTFAATLGTLVIVFQYLLDYVGIDFSTPIVLYLFVVAIGTDYNILMAERVREAFVGGETPRDAAQLAITKNGQTAAAAGVILALTFASLTLTGLKNLAELGAGVAIGVVLASCVMAPMLVPALSVIERSALVADAPVGDRDRGGPPLRRRAPITLTRMSRRARSRDGCADDLKGGLSQQLQPDSQRAVDRFGTTVQAQQGEVRVCGCCSDESVVHRATRDTDRREPLDEFGRVMRAQVTPVREVRRDQPGSGACGQSLRRRQAGEHRVHLERRVTAETQRCSLHLRTDVGVPSLLRTHQRDRGTRVQQEDLSVGRQGAVLECRRPIGARRPPAASAFLRHRRAHRWPPVPGPTRYPQR